LRVRSTCGFGPTAAQALGYAEVLRWADGAIARPECERLVYLATRQFARKQRTWFRKWPSVRWIAAPENAEDLARATGEVLEGFDWRRATTGS
jgi:tRNA dimethylallyltransferase